MNKHLKISDYKLMPWKNGLGTTTELAVQKHDVDRADSPFIWRISIAGVTEDGPFSYFPNIDRHILLLNGNGILLDAKEIGLFSFDQKLKLLTFSGDWDVTGRLIKGPIIDLNIMVDRRNAKAKIEIIEIGNGEQTIPLKSSINFIYALDVPTTILMTHQKKIINLQREESYIAEQSDQTIS
ncbi:MAG: HutD family protein [Proteobacteria bacterium]|jgi:uncharacterized protein|nr:HutD family protein [Pseudomonadota bacterium]